MAARGPSRTGAPDRSRLVERFHEKVVLKALFARRAGLAALADAVRHMVDLQRELVLLTKRKLRFGFSLALPARNAQLLTHRQKRASDRLYPPQGARENGYGLFAKNKLSSLGDAHQELAKHAVRQNDIDRRASSETQPCRRGPRRHRPCSARRLRGPSSRRRPTRRPPRSRLAARRCFPSRPASRSPQVLAMRAGTCAQRGLPISSA
jgi:hypothetical protein